MRPTLLPRTRSFALMLLSLALLLLGGGHAANAQPRAPSASPSARGPVMAAPASPKLDPTAAGPLYVEWNGSYWPARVLRQLDDRRFVVTYPGWGSEWDETVGPERMANEIPPPRRGYRAGESVYVEWRGSHWPATVRSVAGDHLAIHYEGWGAEWDEKVGPERVKSLRPLVTPSWPTGLLAVGRAVEVSWGGQWWPATIKAVRPGRRALIHYEGWGEEWDETVGPERVRPRRSASRDASFDASP